MKKTSTDNTKILSHEETAAIHSAIAFYLGKFDFKITSVSSHDGRYVYKTDEVIIN